MIFHHFHPPREAPYMRFPQPVLQLDFACQILTFPCYFGILHMLRSLLSRPHLGYQPRPVLQFRPQPGLQLLLKPICLCFATIFPFFLLTFLSFCSSKLLAVSSHFSVIIFCQKVFLWLLPLLLPRWLLLLGPPTPSCQSLLLQSLVGRCWFPRVRRLLSHHIGLCPLRSVVIRYLFHITMVSYHFFLSLRFILVLLLIKPK